VSVIAAHSEPALFAKGRFFVHPAFDYLVIAGGLSLAFAIGMATLSLDVTLRGALTTLFIVANGAHFAASTMRLYTRPGVMQTQPMLSLALPVVAVLFVTAAIALPEPLGLLFVATYLVWSPYHYSAQAYGLAVMYGYRAGTPLGREEKRAIRLACLLPFVWTLLQPQGGLASVLRFWTVTAPAPLDDIRGMVSHVLVSITLFAPFALALWLRVRRGVMLPLISVLVIGSNAVWWTFFNILDAFMWVSVFHGLQYLGIVTIFHVKDRMRTVGNRHGRAWHVATFYGACVVLGYVLFEVWPSAYAWAGYDLTRSALLVTAAINLHHFIVDAYIWRLRRDPNYANVVDAEPVAAVPA